MADYRHDHAVAHQAQRLVEIGQQVAASGKPISRAHSSYAGKWVMTV